ncbi:hypothetical protein AB4536_19890, partial [Vibrio cyclitrophicus]
DLFRKKINNFGDISYGVYIYAFPIQQALISSFPEFYFSLYVFFSFFVVVSVSIFSWKFVEKPFLKLKSVYFF